MRAGDGGHRHTGDGRRRRQATPGSRDINRKGAARRAPSSLAAQSQPSLPRGSAVKNSAPVMAVVDATASTTATAQEDMAMGSLGRRVKAKCKITAH